jgi:hypothetical protein
MNDKQKLIQQTGLAFNFINKLYMEISYLIKEIEGILSLEEEKFVIGRSSGYAVTARSSTGLESNNVELWLMKKFSVFFVPKSIDKKDIEGGQTTTPITKDLKVLYLRVVLEDRTVQEPVILSGLLHQIEKKDKAKWIKKFEQFMGHFEYNDSKIFKNLEKIDYEDPYIKVHGKLLKTNLYDIKNSEDIIEKIITPTLEIYRKK